MGKRMKSVKPKVLHEVLFKPMIEWVYDAAIKAGIEKICVVTGYNREMVEAQINGRADCVWQSEQLGTGDAAMRAMDFVRTLNDEDDVLILCGDAPLVSSGTISEAYNKAHCGNKNDVTVFTAILSDPTGYGRIINDSKNDDVITDIREEKDATDVERQIKEINGGSYWMKVKAFKMLLPTLKNNNGANEYYLTDIIKSANENGMKAGRYLSGDAGELEGANDRAQLLSLNEHARDMLFTKHMLNGVSIIDKSGITIGPDAVIDSDTVILPGTILRGKCVIGTGCVIGPNTLLENAILGDGVTVNSSQIYSSKIGSGTRVGPFSYIRPDCVVGEKVKIGDFVELKNSTLGDGTSVSHLTYIGDSDFGKKINVGCGTVTVNYDGRKKYRTKVGDNAFIGCNTNLVAPVKIGTGAYTAAGSTITVDVPENSLAIARERQTIKTDWMIKTRENNKDVPASENI